MRQMAPLEGEALELGECEVADVAAEAFELGAEGWIL